MSQSRVPAPEPSEIAGRYQVVQKLGAGAFGTVYKAKDKILGRMVAIKTIRLEGLAAAGTSVAELVDRFQREAQISAQLKHPNIVTIYDIGEVDGLSYLAMEFIDGVGLDRIVASAGPLPVERAALIAAQVADALDFAHRNSVVHRDIKPANIMIEAGDRVKVTDFGIAKVTTSGDHLTITGSLLGTPSYMSPEQARGMGLDGRSDLFAVGCLLYEMLSGRKAFRGDSITSLIFKIITEEPVPLQELDLNLPQEMVRIVTKAINKAPERRYQTGRELAEDLAAFTRPGTVPTLRQSETPTEPALPAGPGAATTVPPLTLRTAPTTGLPAAAPTRVSAPPPLPTRMVAPPTHVAAPSPRVAAPPAPPPATAPTPRRGAGIAIGAGVAVAGLLVAVAVAGWFIFLRKGPDAASRARLAGEVQPGISATLPGAPPPAQPPATLREASASEPTPPTAPATSVAEQGKAGAGRIPGWTAATPVPRGDEPRSRPTGPAPSSPRSSPGSSVREAESPSSSEESSILDEEPPPLDGAAAGRRLAETYRSDQGSSSGSFGASGRLRPRERIPRNLAPAERPAVNLLLWIIRAEEAFQKKNGRYGTFPELVGAQLLPLDVPAQATAFSRKNYRFQLTIEDDGFKVTAMPLSPTSRPFTGDDTGIIRPAIE